VALDIFDDNLCLWCCIAVYQGVRPNRCTKAERDLAQAFLKLKTPRTAIPKTSLDALNKSETHLNRDAWLGIRVYEPDRQENGELVWHLRKNASERLQNSNNLNEFLIKDIKKLARLYACVES